MNPRAGTGDLGQARAALAAGLTQARKIGAATWSAFLAEEQARLHGDSNGIRGFVEGYEAIGATGHAARLRAELGADGPGG